MPPRPANPIRTLLKQMPIYANFKQLGHYPDYWWWQPARPGLGGFPTSSNSGPSWSTRERSDSLPWSKPERTTEKMIAAVAHRFRRIYSIELDPRLACLAQKRFHKCSHVEIMNSDSQTAVPMLLQRLNERCLWWLDAGYYGWSGGFGNPNRLGSELNAILADRIPDHVILMDDADGVNGQAGTPKLEELIASIESEYPNRHVEVAHNILRITP